MIAEKIKCPVSTKVILCIGDESKIAMSLGFSEKIKGKIRIVCPYKRTRGLLNISVCSLDTKISGINMDDYIHKDIGGNVLGKYKVCIYYS